MLTVQTEILLKRLKAGQIEPADGDALAGIAAQDFLSELGSTFGYRFQERHLPDKWELGMARSLQFTLTALRPKDSVFPAFLLIPLFRDCLFVSGERDAITGISRLSRLAVLPIRSPFRGLALTTHAGHKLDRMPDGWVVKSVEKRTVKLSDEFLKQRGWRFPAEWLAAAPIGSL